MEDNSLKERAIEILRRSGEEALDQFLESIGDPEERIDLCSDMLLHFYWNRKDLTKSLKYGKLGIECHGELPTRENTARHGESSAIDRMAKCIHYNIASFTWPGWDEPGIAIADEELDLGLHSARMNLKLAEELQRGPLAEARAQWLLACHLIARGEYSEASIRFESSTVLFRKAENADEELMATGFLQMTQILSGDPNAGAELQATLDRLSEFDGGKPLVTQIETALKYFTRGKAQQQHRSGSNSPED